MSQFTLEIDSPLSRIPQRTTHKPVVVLKFGGTTVGSTPDEGRIKTARLLIADYLERGLFVVPVFSAFRRGRSGSSEKVSITDRLQSYASIIEGADRFEDGVATFRRLLQSPHEGMLHDLKLQDDRELRAELDGEIDHLVKTAALCCRAHESIPSLDAELITGGERLATRILSAYFNRLHADGRFPLRTARVTGAEMGLFTDSTFRNASIDWSRAVEHAREVLLGKYLEAGVLPIVTGFDGIYDPKFIELATATSNGDLSTSVGAPTDSTDAGKTFLAAYEKAGFKEPAAAYGGYSYDAANAIIEALKTSLKDATDAKSAREATIKAMSSVSFDGVTGKVGFDEFGDAVSRVLTVYKVTDGKWVADKTDTFK